GTGLAKGITSTRESSRVPSTCFTPPQLPGVVNPSRARADEAPNERSAIMAGSSKTSGHTHNKGDDLDKSNEAAAGTKGQDTGSGLMDKAKDVAANVADKAKDVASNVAGKAGDAVSTVGEKMSSLGSTIREKGPQSGFLGSATSGVASAM